MDLFKETGVELRVGIVEYRDITCDGDKSTVIHYYSGSVWHTTADQVEGTLGKISVGGGGDTPETPIDALGNLIERGDKTSAFWSNYESDDWDPSTNRFAVLITDADYKVDNNYGYSSMDAFINDCVFSARKLTVSVVTDSYYKDTYNALVERTGGIFDLSASTPDITGLKILSATAEGSSLTIQGLGFGDEPGSIVLSKYVVAKQEAGQKSEPIGATVSSWNDDSIVCRFYAECCGLWNHQRKYYGRCYDRLCCRGQGINISG